MSQPKWKLIANLGDVNPVDYGGYFVFEDETGVYPAEGELLESPDDDEGEWRVYRFILDRCTFIDGVLSDNPYHPSKPAWFASPSNKGDKYTVFADIASFGGQSAEDLIADICSDDLIRRAWVYRLIGEYHGFENLDSYPLTLTDRAEVETRYESLS